MCLLFKFLISIKSLFGVLIESLKISNIWLVLKEIWEVVAELLNEHSKLCAPVTDVVGSHDIIAEELKDSADTVSLNSRSKMSDVHILCDIWA